MRGYLPYPHTVMMSKNKMGASNSSAKTHPLPFYCSPASVALVFSVSDMMMHLLSAELLGR